MFAKFYGFSKLPFQLTPDPFFFFESAEHRRAMAHLTYGLHNAEGFIIITGEVGAGKTMVVDCLLSQIDPRSFVAAKIVTSQLGGDDLLRMVSAGFGIDHAGLPKAGLLNRIQEFILSLSGGGRRALLIIDEAQNLSFDALEELRMLSNIVAGTTTALQSFLVGQPQLRVVLGNPALDQLRQRIMAAYHLRPLTEPDTRGYVEHRLRCVGWTGDPHLTDDSFTEIHRHTDGVPRRINNLCSRVLLFGMLEDSHTISGSTVQQVATDLAAELSAIVAATNGPAEPGTPAERSALQGIVERLNGVENVTALHDHAIRRMIEIVARYVQQTEADEPR